MIETIARIGNSQALISDAAMRVLTGLKPGDQAGVTVHEGSTVLLPPMLPAVSAEQAAATARTPIRENAGVVKRLA